MNNYYVIEHNGMAIIKSKHKVLCFYLSFFSIGPYKMHSVKEMLIKF